MIPKTPRGFRDVLPTEAAWRRSTSDAVCRQFELWGYEPIETPAVELAAVLDEARSLDNTAAQFTTSAEAPFRFFDSDSNLVVLRPDVTIPVARLTATRLVDRPGPFRFYYREPVFTERASTYGQERQFTQLGIEFIGRGGYIADAEVLCVCMEALSAAGVRDYTVAIGTVGVLNALVGAACDDAAWRDRVLRAFHKSDMVAVDALSREDGVKPAYGDAIARLARLRGGAEAFEACRALCEPLGCVDGLDDLERTYELVIANTDAGKLIVDFSIVSSFDYYTGLVFKAYAPQVPASLVSGGRYDTTLAAFGRNEPAAGFAIGLERVLAAIEAQGATPPESGAQETLCGDDPYELFARAAELRAQGVRVELGGE
ncbi:MAG: ATP phosphoribosyltransferase regulatory subunit [Coriobacteriales bacterium]